MKLLFVNNFVERDGDAETLRRVIPCEWCAGVVETNGCCCWPDDTWCRLLLDVGVECRNCAIDSSLYDEDDDGSPGW